MSVLEVGETPSLFTPVYMSSLPELGTQIVQETKREVTESLNFP